ncbi:hypothetical protein HK104_004752 [Borealophlyctis nickersoniae]|nr:hypothetical protein HK104_004752 [Borealophlyctis nickersoniae]
MQQYMTAYSERLKAHCGGQHDCECGFHKLAFNLCWVCELMGCETSLKNQLVHGVQGLEKFVKFDEEGDDHVPHDVGDMSMIMFKLKQLRETEDAERAEGAEDLPAYTCSE